MVHLVFHPSEVDELSAGHDKRRERSLALILKLTQLQIL